MSEHDVPLDHTQESVDELMRKVSVLRAKRTKIHAEIVHPGVAGCITDPEEPSTPELNARLRDEYDAA